MNDCILDPRRPRADGYIPTPAGSYAHRDAWETAFGGPVPPGWCVLHRCDVRNCINPEHLFLGSKGDNNRDRSAKGRSTTHNAKLTPEAVIAIRHAAGLVSQRKLAIMHGVSQRAIGNVIHGRTYL